MTKDIKDPLPSKENIKNLLKYLPIFNTPAYSAGERKIEEVDGTTTIWPYSYNETVENFMNSCYKEGFIYSYDWPGYSKKAAEIEKRKPPYEGASLFELCKILTGHIRNERFCEGHISCVVEDGSMSELLGRLEQIYKIIANRNDIRVKWIQWKESPVCGHGIEFHKKEFGDHVENLIGFLEGFELLHGVPDEVHIHYIKPDDRLITLEEMKMFKLRVESYVKVYEMPWGVDVFPEIICWVNW